MDKRVLILLLSLISLGSSYDTGHHADLTRNALEVLGYNPNAQIVGAVSNWFVDYFSYTPETDAVQDLKSLHFDNLFHLMNISNYMTQLVRNTMNATRYAVQRNDPVTYLSIIGASSHAIQDFYTHSSWAEHHQTSCGCYRDDTWFSDLNSVNGNVTALFDKLQSVATYSWGDGCNEFERNCLPGQVPHGGYCQGINKDSYVRPWFERSYGHSFAATVEWVYNIQLWAESFAGNTNLIDAAKNYSPSSNDLAELNEDLRASIIVSYATKVPLDGEEDGHYKGAGSGDYKRLISATAKFISRNSIYKQKFTDEKVWQYLTSPNLYDVANYDQNTFNNSISAALQFVTPYTSLPAALTSYNKFKLRTVYVSAEKSVGRPSPYAIVNIDGMNFWEAVQHNTNDFYPHWTTIKYIPSTTLTLNVAYALWDDQFPQGDQRKPIIGDVNGDLDLLYDVASHNIAGDINGIYDSRSNYFNTSASGSFVSIYMTTQRYGQCVQQGMPEPYCPLEAYTELRVHSACDFEDNGIINGSASTSPMLAVLFVFAAMFGIFM